jgi:hypothetical protein
MRIGSENKKKLGWMVVLLTVATLALIYDFHDLRTVSSTAPDTTRRGAVPGRPSGLQTDQQSRLSVELLPSIQQKMFEIGLRNIFRMQEIEIKHQKSPGGQGNVGKVQAPNDLSPPPPPFTFFGFADKYNEPRRIFLLGTSTVFIARRGDTIHGRYRIIAVSQNSVTVEDLLSNYQELIALSGQ